MATAALSHALSLRLRDLDHPVAIYKGSIPACVEFDHQTFGNLALSRRSGRPDAFQWTSLVRVGQEAQRLALRVNALEGVTGLPDITGQIANIEASDTIWRFSTAETAGPQRSAPMVTGDTLRHLTETGDISDRTSGLLTDGSAREATPPAVRPRFSQSSLVGLYIVELLLHAISEVNSASPDSPFAAQSAQRTDVRQIQRVILMSPLAMPSGERQILVQRVQGAIDLLWRTQGWDQVGVFSNPVKPQLTLGLGPDVGLQLMYLFNEVKAKFGGGFSDFIDCVRRRAGEPDARDNVRISSIELGQRSAGLTVIDYDVSHDGTVQAALVLADRTPVGGERVIEAIIERYLLAAIERELAACGVADAHAALVDLMSQGAGSQPNQSALGTNLFAKILRPAAVGVFETYTAMPRRGAEGLRRYKLNDLVALGGGRLYPVATQVNEAAAQAGAKGFNLTTVAFDIGRRHVQQLVQAELWPAINAMATAIQDYESDILLIVGDLAQMPDLLDHVLTLSPVPAGRIVVLGPSENGSAPADTRRQSTTQSNAVLGAYLAGQNLLETNGFSLATRNLVRALGDDGRPDGRHPHALSNLTTDTAVAPLPLERAR